MIGILSGEYVANRLRAILPELETVTLYNRLPTDGYGSGVSWTAKREEAGLDDLIQAGVEGTDTGISFTLISSSAVQQVMTLTVVGTVTTAGNATVTVRSSALGTNPTTLSVAVSLGDSASTVGGKVRTALAADATVAAVFTVSGSGAVVTLTQTTAGPMDQAAELTVEDGTCDGLTQEESLNSPAPPNVLDRIVDAQGTYWTVKRSDPVKLFQRVFKVTCIMEL